MAGMGRLIVVSPQGQMELALAQIIGLFPIPQPGQLQLKGAACGIGQLGGRLWVSGPEVGEVLCPLGMHGQSKKLSDLLIDAKVPASERAAVPVVRAGVSGPVLWVAPLRADERARVTDASRVLLELAWRPK